MRCEYPERMRATAKESMWGNARNLVGDSTPLRRRARRRPKPQRRSPPRSHGLCACCTDLSSALSKHLLAEKAQQFNTYTTRGDTPTRTRTPRHATPRHATPRHATPRHAFSGHLWYGQHAFRGHPSHLRPSQRWQRHCLGRGETPHPRPPSGYAVHAGFRWSEASRVGSQ